MESTSAEPSRKRLATQAAILDAAAALIAEKGVDGFTLSEVAQRGSVNRALIYHYFHDRDNLVFQAIRHIVKRYEETEPRTGLDTVERTARMHIEHPEIGRFFFQLLLTGRPMPELSKRIHAAIDDLQRLKAQHAPDSDFDPQLSVITGWLAQLVWSFTHTEIARLLDIPVDEADERFIAQLRRARTQNAGALGARIS